MAREYGMSPGRSQAQYGHAGHAGKTQQQAHRDQRQGRDTPQQAQHITGGAAPPAAVTRVPDFVRQPVGPGTTFPDYRSTVPQGFLQGIGNKFRDFTIKMRGYNEDENRPNTQAEYEAARQNRINQKRIQNITSRDIPWREQTLQTLGNLGYQGDLSRSQIGSTPFDRYPPRVGTVVEDAAAGIRATDAAQDMIYPKPRPEGPITNQDRVANPLPVGRDQGSFQFRDPQGYYMENRPEFGYDRFDGPIGSTGLADRRPYINYQELNPNPYSWEGRNLSQEERQDPFWGEKEYNPMLMDALINQKNRSGELVPTEYIPSYDTTDVTSLDEVPSNLYADVSPADIKAIKGFRFNKNQKAEDARAVIEMSGQKLNPTITDQEIEDIIQGTITEPTGQFAAKGGYMRSRYSNGGRVGILAAF